MKKVILAVLFVLASFQASAFTIGGAYAQLESCTYGQYGYQYGNIGTYLVNGQLYQVFFGSNYCQY